MLSNLSGARTRARSCTTLLLLVCASAGAASQACSPDDTAVSASDDGGNASVDAGSASDAAANLDAAGDTGASNDDAPAVTCNALAPAAAVSIHAHGGAAPSPLGGTVADGTYHVVAATLYTAAFDAGGVSVGTSDVRMRISGTTAQIANTSKGTPRTETDTFSFSGDTVTITPTCPPGAKGATATFTALDADAGADVPKGGFEFYVTENGATAVLRMALE